MNCFKELSNYSELIKKNSFSTTPKLKKKFQRQNKFFRTHILFFV